MIPKIFWRTGCMLFIGGYITMNVMDYGLFWGLFSFLIMFVIWIMLVLIFNKLGNKTEENNNEKT